MAYEIRSDKGLPIRKQGDPVLATDTLQIKIEQLDEQAKSFVAIASTEDEDRDKDIIRQEGWKLTNFKKNPIVPWSHNYYGVPVAKSMKTWVDNKNQKGPRLLFMPKFDSEDDDSIKVFNKYKNGFLTSFSVGFRGIKFNFRNEEERWFGGREYLQQELLEISAVAIPANPNATTRLTYTGDKEPENLIQLGYPEIFAKTNMGLFYPVMDVAMFAQSKEFEIEKGVTGVNAVPLDDELSITNPVAYIFDPEKFDDKSANEWIKKNVERKWEIKYIDLHNDKKDDFSLEGITAEDDIKYFETSVDLSGYDISDKVDDDENKSDDSDIKTDKKDDETDEKEVLDSKDDKGVTTEESSEDKSKGTGDDKDDVKDIDTVDQPSGEVTIPVKRIIEVVTTIKDSDNNVIDQSAEVVASNKEFQSVHEYLDWKSNELISLFKSEIKGLKESLAKLSEEKTIANPIEIPDNKDHSDISDDDSEQNKSTNDEEFELDDSLIDTPGSNEKTNSDDLIEIDDNMFDESSDIKNTVNETLVEKLRRTLKEALSGASGNID